MEFLIYLDVCCLNRPFDNQTQERIRLETDAILYILAKFQNGEWQLLGSEAFDDELGNTRDRDEILGNPTIEEIVAEIKQMRQQQDNP
jgi:hypothetical protein